MISFSIEENREFLRRAQERRGKMTLDDERISRWFHIMWQKWSFDQYGTWLALGHTYESLGAQND